MYTIPLEYEGNDSVITFKFDFISQTMVTFKAGRQIIFGINGLYEWSLSE